MWQWSNVVLLFITHYLFRYLLLFSIICIYKHVPYNVRLRISVLCSFTYPNQCNGPCIFSLTKRINKYSKKRKNCRRSVAYAENFHGGDLVQGHMVVICFWCALFVTSQFDVISMFPNQRFGEVCWHSMHIFLHLLSLLYMSLHWIWTIIAPS